MSSCCPSDIPPVVVEGYTPKGQYGTLGGLKTYVTGPADAKTGIFVVYDIFGYFPQTLQGADILSSCLNAVVVIPDFFEGKPMDINAFPPDTEEKKEQLGKFFQTKANLDTTVKKARELAEAFKKETRLVGVEKWAVIGYCWGGKVTTLLSGEKSPFVASAQIHPAFVDPANAKTIAIPHFLYASVDENPEAVAQFEATLKKSPIPAVREKSEVEIRSDMFHGWMAARAKLGEEKYKKGYEEGYGRVVQFLKKNL